MLFLQTLKCDKYFVNVFDMIKMQGMLIYSEGSDDKSCGRFNGNDICTGILLLSLHLAEHK